MVFESFKKTLGLGGGGGGGSTGNFSGKGHILGSAPPAPSSNGSKRGAATPQPSSTTSISTASSSSVHSTQPSFSTRSASAPVDGFSNVGVHTPIGTRPAPIVNASSGSNMGDGGLTTNGSGVQYNNETRDQYMVFEALFTQDRLGMSINEYKDQLPIDKASRSMISSSKRSQLVSRPIVSDVKPDSEAARNGISIGDVIISLNRNQLTNFEDFYNFVLALGRPVTVQFYRPLNTPPLPGSSGLSSVLRPFSGGQKTDISVAPKAPPVISLEEENAKKDAMRNAALERSQAWDKKVTSARSSAIARKEKFPDSEPQHYQQSFSNEDTMRAIQKVREEESKTEQQLGYNPFRPHMSFTGNSVNSISNPGPGPGTNMSTNVTNNGYAISGSSISSAASPTIQQRGVAGMYRSSPSTTMRSPSPRQRPSPQTLPSSSMVQQPMLPQQGISLPQGSNNHQPPTRTLSTNRMVPPLPLPLPSNAVNNMIPSITTIPITTPSPQPEISRTSIEEEREFAQMTADVDDSFAMLISLSEFDQGRVKMAIQTIQKMLLNLINHKDDLKFRSIRISNSAFHIKVGSVPGGIELLLAAGYKFDSSPAEGMPLMSSQSIDNLMMTSSEKMMNASLGTPHLQLSPDANFASNPHGEDYLVHPMDFISDRRLNYTLSRLNELLELQQTIFS